MTPRWLLAALLSAMLAACNTPTAPSVGARSSAVQSCQILADCPTVGKCYARQCTAQNLCVPSGDGMNCCAVDGDCNDADPCTTDTCNKPDCVHTASGAAGCCTPPLTTGCAAANACQNPAVCSQSKATAVGSCSFTAKQSGGNPIAGCCNDVSDCGTGTATCVGNTCTCGGSLYCTASKTCEVCCASGDCTTLPTPAVCYNATGTCNTGAPPNTCSYTLKSGSKVCGATCCNAINGVCSAACALTCTSGFADCDANPSNGCEVNLGATSQKLCGATCVAASSCCTNTDCNTPPSPASCYPAQGVCSGVGGTCSYTLNAGSSVCGGTTCCNAINGTCNVSCMLSCTSGFADCDGAVANGCEVNLSATSQKLCGSTCIAASSCCTGSDCNTPPAPAACYAAPGTCPGAGGTCMYSPKTGSRVCSSTCCNAIGGSCNLDCSLTCTGGLGDCDSNPANGCESMINTTTRCGSCGNACAPATNSCQTPVCNGGTTCGYSSTGGAGCCTTNAGTCTPNTCQTAMCAANRCVYAAKVGVTGCCTVPSDCPAPGSCMLATCIGNTCGTGFDPACPDGGIVDMARPDLSIVDLSTQDLSILPPPDLSTPDLSMRDLSTPRDLSVPDLQPPPDLNANLGPLSPSGGGGCAFAGDSARSAWGLAAIALLFLAFGCRKKLG